MDGIGVNSTFNKLDAIYDSTFNWYPLAAVKNNYHNAGIYIIRSLDKTLYYVGQSIDLGRRLSEHREARDNDSPALHKAIKELGVDNFEYCIAKDFGNDFAFYSEVDLQAFRDSLNEEEKNVIALYQSTTNNGGLNLTLGGNGGSPLKLSFKEINEIRRRLKLGRINTLDSLAQQFNVDAGTIENIRDNVGIYSLIADDNENLPTEPYRTEEQNNLAANTKRTAHAKNPGTIYKVISVPENSVYKENQLKIFGKVWGTDKTPTYFMGARNALKLITCRNTDSSIKENQYIKDAAGNRTGELNIGGFILAPTNNLHGAPIEQIAFANLKAKRTLDKYYESNSNE